MSTPTDTHRTPSQEDQEELLLSCRYGDLEDVQAFVANYGPRPLSDAQDEHGNTVLHMACGNGHVGEQFFSHTRKSRDPRSQDLL